jgi:hypothetical protein
MAQQSAIGRYHEEDTSALVDGLERETGLWSVHHTIMPFDKCRKLMRPLKLAHVLLNSRGRLNRRIPAVQDSPDARPRGFTGIKMDRCAPTPESV